MSKYVLPKSRSGHKTAAGSIDHVLAFIDTYEDTPKLKKITASTGTCVRSTKKSLMV
jgi:hypothetical protein